jgi:hypothetical protein
MAEQKTVAQQEMMANAKVDRLNDRVSTPVRAANGWDEAKLVLRDLKNNAIDVGKGSIAGTLGAPVDLMAMATMVGYSGLNWLNGGDFVMGDIADLPGGTESFGQLLGADEKGAPFTVGSFFSPGGLVKGAVTGAKVAGATKAMFIGARAATPAVTRPLAKAKGMEKLGMDQDEIWQQTGWWKEGDDWKYVLSDAESVVDNAVIQQKAATRAMKVGDEDSFGITLGELFDHPTLYDAYPQLRNVPINVHVKRIDDAADGTRKFEIYNEAMHQAKIAASVETTPSGKFLNLYDDLDSDLGRSSILHEVQHLVQTIEDFDPGASSQKFLARILDTTQASVNKRIVDDIVSGELTPFLDEQTYRQYMMKVSDEFKLDVTDVEDAMDDFLFAGADIEEARILTTAAAERTARDLRLMVEEVSQGMPKEAAAELAKALHNNLSFAQTKWLARQRYLRQGGEVEARLTQTLRDQTQEALAASRKPPLADQAVLLNRKIIGDASSGQ